MYQELHTYKKLIDESCNDQSCLKESKERTIDLYDWVISYIDPLALASSIEQLLIQKLNDFSCDKASPIILDCGANIGVSILNYKRLFPNSKIVAFEPDPVFLPHLKRNVIGNDIDDVSIVDSAVWVENTEISWFSEGRDGSRIVDSQDAHCSSMKIKAIDLKDFLESEVDLLKLDIEGAEYKVIKHIQDLLSNVNNIIIECHINQNSYVEFSNIIDILKDSGFDISINSFGAWKDLTRFTTISAAHWEQYMIVSGSREVASGQQSRLSSSEYHTVESLSAKCGCQKSLENLIYQAEVLDSYEMRTKVLDRPYQHDGGYAYKILLPNDVICGDTESNRTSHLVLFEDDLLLGPPNSIHEEIRLQGFGQFSHWHNTLYFSSSDGSNPNETGKKFKIIYLSKKQKPVVDRNEC